MVVRQTPKMEGTPIHKWEILKITGGSLVDQPNNVNICTLTRELSDLKGSEFSLNPSLGIELIVLISWSVEFHQKLQILSKSTHSSSQVSSLPTAATISLDPFINIGDSIISGPHSPSLCICHQYFVTRKSNRHPLNYRCQKSGSSPVLDHL